MDRNKSTSLLLSVLLVALRKESVDRNGADDAEMPAIRKSLSARRAWIEIDPAPRAQKVKPVALRKESVDRNTVEFFQLARNSKSLSARRAWIEIDFRSTLPAGAKGRSPQGERG